MRTQLAKRMTKANEVVAAYINDATPGAYSLNRNYAAYTIERVSGNIGFTLWDESAILRRKDGFGGINTMKQVDIMESVVAGIEKQIFDEWKHEGFIGGWTSAYIDFEIDGKEYVICLYEVHNSEHWSRKTDDEGGATPN